MISQEQSQKIMKTAWEKRMSETSRHVKLNGWLHSYEHLTSQYEKQVLHKVDFNDKTVIDYGIGGGWIGKYLFDKGIKKYYGYDIAQTQIDFAKETLKDKNAELFLTDNFPEEVPEDIDVLVCLSVIQHFVGELYLKTFFKRLNVSNIKTLVLSIREGDEKAIKEEQIIYTTSDIAYGCYITKKYVKEKLKDYKMIYTSERDAANQTFMIFERR